MGLEGHCLVLLLFRSALSTTSRPGSGQGWTELENIKPGMFHETYDRLPGREHTTVIWRTSVNTSIKSSRDMMEYLPEVSTN